MLHKNYGPFLGFIVSLDGPLNMDRVQLSVGCRVTMKTYFQVPRNPGYSLDCPLKDEWLKQFLRHLMVLNLGSLVWQACTLTTRSLLYKLCKLLLVFSSAEIEL